MTTVTDDNACYVIVEHLPLHVRLSAAEWCLQKYGQQHVNLWKMNNNKACFYFETEQEASWFALRWL